MIGECAIWCHLSYRQSIGTLARIWGHQPYNRTTMFSDLGDKLINRRQPLDAGFDRGSTFWPFGFLNDGAKLVGNRPLRFSDSPCVPRPWNSSSSSSCDFVLISFLGQVLSSLIEDAQKKKWCISIAARVIWNCRICYRLTTYYRTRIS